MQAHSNSICVSQTGRRHKYAVNSPELHNTAHCAALSPSAGKLQVQQCSSIAHKPHEQKKGPQQIELGSEHKGSICTLSGLLVHELNDLPSTNSNFALVTRPCL
jgi:hypothetical protein